MLCQALASKTSLGMVLFPGRSSGPCEGELLVGRICQHLTCKDRLASIRQSLVKATQVLMSISTTRLSGIYITWHKVFSARRVQELEIVGDVYLEKCKSKQL